MDSHILHVISKSHPLLGKYMHIFIFHVISKSHPLWQVHAPSHLTHHRRKFRSQTSDNMDRWKAEQGRGREKRKIRREKIRRERVRRKKMQVRKKVGKSQNTVFFGGFVAPEGWKVGSLKRRMRRHLGRWEMNNCTPLWREAHFEVKMYKAHQVRTTFGSWDVEKVHAVVARSTFWSQNVQNTPCPDHFWKLRCRKSARRCGAKHSWRSIVYGSWFTIHSLRAMVYESWPSWFTNHGLRAMVCESWFTIHSLRAMVYEPWFTIHSLRAMVYRSRSQPDGGVGGSLFFMFFKEIALSWSQVLVFQMLLVLYQTVFFMLISFSGCQPVSWGVFSHQLWDQKG